MTGLHTASYPVTTNESLCALDEENDEVGGSKMKRVKERKRARDKKREKGEREDDTE